MTIRFGVVRRHIRWHRLDKISELVYYKNKDCQARRTDEQAARVDERGRLEQLSSQKHQVKRAIINQQVAKPAS